VASGSKLVSGFLGGFKHRATEDHAPLGARWPRTLLGALSQAGQKKSERSWSLVTKKQEKREFLEEGKKVKDKLAYEKRTLENIKKEKMHELETSGVPKKYLGDLAKKKIIV